MLNRYRQEKFAEKLIEKCFKIQPKFNFSSKFIVSTVLIGAFAFEHHDRLFSFLGMGNKINKLKGIDEVEPTITMDFENKVEFVFMIGCS
jgi:hypothetical protein